MEFVVFRPLRLRRIRIYAERALRREQVFRDQNDVLGTTKNFVNDID